MSKQRISETLVRNGDNTACRECGHVLAAGGSAWKHHASLTAVMIRSLPGAPMAANAELVLRRFACPNCGSLLDTETAMPGDPFLEDVIHG